jgi:hypothetical protein
MNEEERANEIQAIKKLLSEVEAMARYQMIQVEKLRAPARGHRVAIKAG